MYTYLSVRNTVWSLAAATAMHFSFLRPWTSLGDYNKNNIHVHGFIIITGEKLTLSMYKNELTKQVLSFPCPSRPPCP